MSDGVLEVEGFAFYVDELRRGSEDPYIAYRVCERSWALARSDVGLLRRAVIRLIEADPWFLATVSPHVLCGLETADLAPLTPSVGAGPAQRNAAMLRAVLWYHARRGPYHPDRAGRAQLRRALGFLQDVPRNQRDRTWHEMLVGCYRVLDHDAYKRAFPKLLAATPAEWRAFALHGFLGVLAAKRDWRTYDRYRRAWDRLPPDHHSCECYVNDVYTNDGLRALAARRWDAVPAALAGAGAVRGCAHLNTGGLRLDLVRKLVASKRMLVASGALDAARSYLRCAAAFGQPRDELAALTGKLDAATA